MSRITLLAVSGSLRAGSTNTALLEAAAVLAPPGVVVRLYAGLAGLPHYNPDREDEPIPAVQDLRAQIHAADGLLLSSPEYAHGVPGALKNALDWLVGGTDIVGKPVALLNASPYSTHVQAALGEILATMSARPVPAAAVTVPLRGRPRPADGIAQDPAIAGPVRAALAALVQAIEADRPPGA